MRHKISLCGKEISSLSREEMSSLGREKIPSLCREEISPDRRGKAPVGAILAQPAESRPAPGLPGFSGIPTGAEMRRSEIVAFGGCGERVSQIQAGQVIARPARISAGREDSGPAQI